MLDFHNHLIPAVDDGSESLDQSLAALVNMAAQGITHVITTPHFAASLGRQPGAYQAAFERIDQSWNTLLGAVGEHLPNLKLERGVELALDDPDPVIDDARLRLAGTRFVLVEFPNFSIPPNSARVLARLKDRGITPIVAHPERYENIEVELTTLREWKRSGAHLQLNAGSLIGAYGSRVERYAWRCLRSGIADYLCSDYHARGKCLTARALERVESRGGQSHLKALLEYNGDRLLLGLDPTPVPPLKASPKRFYDLRRFFRLR